jgi:hypothetical protein
MYVKPRSHPGWLFSISSSVDYLVSVPVYEEERVAALACKLEQNGMGISANAVEAVCSSKYYVAAAVMTKISGYQ